MSRRRALSEEDYSSDCSKDDGKQEQIDSCSDNEKFPHADNIDVGLHAEKVSAKYVIISPEEDTEQISSKDSKTHSVVDRNENRRKENPNYKAKGNFFYHDNREANKSMNTNISPSKNNFHEFGKNERYSIVWLIKFHCSVVE